MIADRGTKSTLTEPRPTQLTTFRVFKITIFAALVWYIVAAYIRTRGPLGEFAPNRGWSFLIATLVATPPLNWLARKVAGMPRQSMLTVAAVGAMTPPTLEGIIMRFYPQYYGVDPIVIGQAAVWLLWAIGVGLLLATTTSLRAADRLAERDFAPPIRATTVLGQPLRIPDPDGRVTHIQFLRFAGCPVCNLHLQDFIKREAELRNARLHEVMLFHSEARFINDYHGKLPFDLVADPHRQIYNDFGVEISPWAILNPFGWAGFIKGYALKKAGEFDSTVMGLPADFLIGSNGRIIDCHYGSSAYDSWSVDDVLKRVQAISAMRHPISTPSIGAAA